MELWSGHTLFLPFFVSSWREFKDYIHYKTIISQNVLFEAQVKNFFYFVENLCSALKIFKFLYFQPYHNLPNLWSDDEY